MVIIRCTRKLLARIGPTSPANESSTARLGDWYATPLAIGHQRLILLVCEHSRLPVLMPARDVKHFALNFPDALAGVLWGLGIEAKVIQGEVEETREAVIEKTDNRSLLGTLIDFSHMLKWQLPDDPNLDLVQAALELGHTPVRPLGRLGFPDRVTRELLA